MQQAALPLNGSVLVLNRFFMAVHVVTVRRAFTLLYREMQRWLIARMDDSPTTTLMPGAS